MKPTIIVDSFSYTINQDGDKILTIDTPGHRLHEILSSSKNLFREINFDNSWTSSNNFLIFQWVKKNLVDIITIDQFDANIHKNAFYLIDVGLPVVGLNSLIPQLFTHSAINLLQKYREIKILFFLPYEYYDHNNYYYFLQHFGVDCLKKHLNNKILVLTLTSYVSTMHSTSIAKYENNLLSTFPPNIECIPSITFLGSVMQKQIFSDKPFINQFPETCKVTYKKNKLFLCLNHANRESRLLLLQALHSKNLIQGNIVSKIMNNDLTLELLTWRLHLEKEIYKDETLKKISAGEISNITAELRKYSANAISPIIKLIGKIAEDVDNNFKPPQLFVVTINQTGSNGRMNYNQYFAAEWYQQTWCSIITETFIPMPAGVESPMITEKTLKPILNCHPFVIFGHAHSHTLLQKLGFKTFEQSWFGLPPDGAVGNQSLLERLSNLIESLERLSNMSDEELTAKWQTIVPDLIFNYHHCRNTDWYKLQIDLLTGDSKILE